MQIPVSMVLLWAFFDYPIGLGAVSDQVDYNLSGLGKQHQRLIVYSWAERLAAAVSA